jgi:hypothetical protein
MATTLDHSVMEAMIMKVIITWQVKTLAYVFWLLAGFTAFLVLDIFVHSLEHGHGHNLSHAKTNGN